MPAVGPLSIDRHDPAFLLVLLFATQSMELDYDAMAKVSQKVEDPRMWTTASNLQRDFSTLLTLGERLREEAPVDDDNELEYIDPSSAELNPEHGVWIGQAIRSSENQHQRFENRQQVAWERFVRTFGDVGLDDAALHIDEDLERGLLLPSPITDAASDASSETSLEALTPTQAAWSQALNPNDEIVAAASPVTSSDPVRATTVLTSNEDDAGRSTTPEADNIHLSTEEWALFQNGSPPHASRADSSAPSCCHIQFCDICLSSHICRNMSDMEHIGGSNNLDQELLSHRPSAVGECEENEHGFR